MIFDFLDLPVTCQNFPATVLLTADTILLGPHLVLSKFIKGSLSNWDFSNSLTIFGGLSPELGIFRVPELLRVFIFLGLTNSSRDS